ncbi:MAG: Hsp70 family protein [Polyangiaceae bacterium]|nr:Hsp70 family protein [Polyangiaceae bacterium]
MPQSSSSTLADLRWVAVDSGQLGTVRELTGSAMFIVTRSPLEVGTVVRFELRNSAGALVASGVARVLITDEAGVGLSLLSFGIDQDLVARLNRPVPAPPPLPLDPAKAARVQVPPFPVRRAPVPREEPPSIPVPPPTKVEVSYVGDGEDMVDMQVEQLVFSQEGVIIGIDLGTTNTVVAHVKDGRATIIPSRTGAAATPSMITFDPSGRYFVGQRAVDRQVMYPERTVYGSKRLMGRTYRLDVAQELQTHFAFPLGEADGQRFGVRLRERVVSMDTIAARILDEVRAAAEEHLGQRVGAAVITVPAYFSEVQREAVRRAAGEANLVVHRIVNEPTAAAVAYGSKLDHPVKLAVWDFGGGTFDCSVVSVEDDAVQVLATGGDNFLGGSDFDDLVAGHLLAEFQQRESLVFDPTLQQIARLRQAAENAKKILSVEETASIEVIELTKEPRRDLRTTMSRDQFSMLIEDLVARAVHIAREVVANAGLAPGDIDDVVLVGGSSRVVAVQEAAGRLFGKRPSKRINADEAVALGAAQLGAEIGAGIALRDILPMSIGRGVPGPLLEVIVPRYSRLPSTTELLVDADLLGSVSVPLFQGEAAALKENEYLCTVVVEDRSLWDGGRVKLCLSFDEHCVMTVEARDAKTARPLPVTLDRSRQLLEVLRELGVATRPDGSLPPPPVPEGGLFRRLRTLLG